MSGIYSINTAEKLFNRLVEVFGDFIENPTEEGIYSVIFPLYHLREWICPEGYSSYKNKEESCLSPEELLHSQLHSMKEYEIVRAICNNAKHFSEGGMSDRYGVLEGKRCGLSRCGDAFDITHYMVDDQEIRDIFWPVYQVYFSYFKEEKDWSKK